ncbi:MAG: hypothetical protein ACOYL2_02780 [Burkholderiaceae bacterium]|jgi:hypothetical protein
MKRFFSLCLLLSLIANTVNSLAADKSVDRPMAIDNGGTMTFVLAVRSGKLSPEQKAALETRLQTECGNPTNSITLGMIETRGPGKCMAFVRNQCNCTDCDMPTYCLPENERQ